MNGLKVKKITTKFPKNKEACVCPFRVLNFIFLNVILLNKHIINKMEVDKKNSNVEEDEISDEREEEESSDEEFDNSEGSGFLYGLVTIIFFVLLIYFPFFTYNNPQIVLKNSYLFAFLVNLVICYFSTVNPLKFSYFLFDYKFDGVSNIRILSFLYFIGGVIYIESVLNILLNLNLSTLFEDLLLRTGLIVAFKLLLDTLVGMTRKLTRRFERKK